MNAIAEPLIQDEYTGEPASKRMLAYLQNMREKGKMIAGAYCAYAPAELIRALDMVPASLCAFSQVPIEAAETILPTNLCPLIKSSFGFILTDTCPFYGIADVVIGETTCDGKKKMFELIRERKPTHIMDLPQLPDEPEALDNWTVMIRKLQSFLETTFARKASDAQIEQAIKDSNRRNVLFREICAYATLQPPVVGWLEIYDLANLALGAVSSETEDILRQAIAKLEKRRLDGYTYSTADAPRVLVSGCPLGGDALKVMKIIEEAGGVVVAHEACSGMKPFMHDIEEDTTDPVRALAKHYLELPCSCMSPTERRLTELGKMIEQFKPDAIIDVVLQACHGFNIESFKVGEYVQKRHGLPFLKIVTDYSQSDVGQISTRVEALLESC